MSKPEKKNDGRDPLEPQSGCNDLDCAPANFSLTRANAQVLWPKGTGRPVRQRQVDALREALQLGCYFVSSVQLADCLLQRMRSGN